MGGLRGYAPYRVRHLATQHFLQVLNRPAPEDTGEFDEDDEIAESEIEVDAQTKA